MRISTSTGVPRRTLLHRSTLLLSMLLAVVFPLGVSHAGVTSTWSVESYKDWDEGEAKSTFITSLGEVKPGWKTARVTVEVDGIWASLRLADGSVLLGTDQEGAIYRVRRDKAEALVAIADAVAVVSLAQGPDGTVYAGTMPGGQIWKVDAKAGKASKLAEIADAETVWALAMDAAGETLYAGTGPKGTLVAVNLHSGATKVVFETEDKRILSLAAASDGAIWLGTSDKAQVFRYDPARGTARAIADFSGTEVTALVATRDGAIVAANDLEELATTNVKSKAAVDKALKEPESGEEPDLPSKGTKPGADAPPPPGSQPTRKRGRKGKGALFRVYSDGRLEQLHALTATYFTAIAVTDTGAVFAGAGDKGRIYLVDTDDSVSTAFDVDERMIATMHHVAGEGLMFTTSDAAALYRTAGKATKASYESQVFDTKAPSYFGKVLWHGSDALRVETRTGNTAKPDKGWSSWAAPRGVARAGGDRRAGRVSSPAGRYVQFRAIFGGQSSDEVLRKARVYYLPQNKPTRITGVTVGRPGEEGGVTLKGGAAEPRSPVLELKWTVDNPDEDKTRYELEVRREGDALWRPVVTGKQPLTAKSFDWNTETFPDGYYRLRVTASDDRANSADRALTTYNITGLFLVDNEKPRLDGIRVTYPNASARAIDSMSAIAEMAYSVDDGEWLVGTTSDGIFDDQAELLQLRLPKDLAPGMHTLAIRVADEAGNIGSASVTFRVQ